MFPMDDNSRSMTRQRLAETYGKPSQRRLAAVVVEELAREIIEGNWAEGDVLPREPTMCEEFGFSRTVIREALKLLEERGLVRVEQGRGTTVQPRDSWNLLDPGRAPDRAGVRPRHVAARQPDRRAPRARAGDGARRSDAAHRRRARGARRQHRPDGSLVRRLRALPRARPRFPRGRDEGVRQRGRLDDRPRDPPTRRRHAALSTGSSRAALAGLSRRTAGSTTRSRLATVSSQANAFRAHRLAWTERKSRRSSSARRSVSTAR